MIRNSLSIVLFIDEHKKIIQRNTQEVGKMVESRFISIHPRKEWIANVKGVASSRRLILFYLKKKIKSTHRLIECVHKKQELNLDLNL